MLTMDDWGCVVKRQIMAITVGGPIQIQVVEGLDIVREKYDRTVEPDELFFKPQPANDEGPFDLEAGRTGRRVPPFLD